MRFFLWAALVAGMAAWIARLRRDLQAARLRGDMYREAAARLERRIGALSGQER